MIGAPAERQVLPAVATLGILGTEPIGIKCQRAVPQGGIPLDRHDSEQKQGMPRPRGACVGFDSVATYLVGHYPNFDGPPDRGANY